MIHILICLGDQVHAFTMRSEDFDKASLSQQRDIMQFASLFLRSDTVKLDVFARKDRFGLLQTREVHTTAQVSAYIDAVLEAHKRGAVVTPPTPTIVREQG
jgi:hypothetical protein